MIGGERRRSPLLAYAVFLLLAVVASACSSASGPEGGGESEGGVPKILQFSAPLLSGGTIEGASLAGKDVAIWLWAPW